MMTHNEWPQTREDWQFAVELADLNLRVREWLQAGLPYGLVKPDGTIDAARCTELLAAGETQGFLPGVTMSAKERRS